MIVKLTRAARVPHEAGEIVEVSPDFANILFSQGAAVIMTDGEKDEQPGDTGGTDATGNNADTGGTDDTGDNADTPAPTPKKPKKKG